EVSSSAAGRSLHHPDNLPDPAGGALHPQGPLFFCPERGDMGTRSRRLMAATLLAFLFAGVASVSAQSARPNVLLLFAGDQRADTIAAWGNRHIQTPHLDRLVQRGFSFRNNYCFGSNSGAVCVPSRAMLLSGRTWLDVKADLDGVKLLPELLREKGYTVFA